MKVKQKTKKAIAKRFRLTKTGKVKRWKAGRGHLMSHKSGKRGRQLRRAGYCVGEIAVTYRNLLAPGR